MFNFKNKTINLLKLNINEFGPNTKYINVKI